MAATGGRHDWPTGQNILALDTIICEYHSISLRRYRMKKYFILHLTDKIFRFIPERMKPEDLERQHGTNERIDIDNLADCVRFYMMLVQSTR